jgi:hypothetical protein
MIHHAPCCRELIHLKATRSPFTRIIALDWYDGPRAGLAQCGGCNLEFRFELLDEVINTEEGQDVRILSLAPLPPNSLSRLSDALVRYQAPSSPVWVPLWKFPSEAEQAALDRLTEEILGAAGPPGWVVATPNLSEEILAAEAITAEDLIRVTDWFCFLSLDRKVPLPRPHRVSR